MESRNASATEGPPDRLLHLSCLSPTTTGSPHSACCLHQHQLLGPRHPPQHLGPLQKTVYVIGSSIVRHVKLNGVDGNAAVACFPGACVLDIASRLSFIPLQRSPEGALPDAAGYHQESDECQSSPDLSPPTGRVVSRLFGLQSWLRGWYAVSILGYLDNWPFILLF
ncbi:hypothetical protein NFI96_014721, partial [Prochilodus magdalenae]